MKMEPGVASRRYLASLLNLFELRLTVA